MRKARLRLRRPTGDSGTNMVELTVAMAVMTVLGGMFTAALLNAYRSSSHSEVSATASNQLSIAFERLDAQVRYASAISKPGTVGTDKYVEFATVSTGTATCTQVRLRTTNRQLQQRTWTSGTTPATGGWTVLASGVGATTPFQRIDADADNAAQRLRVTLIGDVPAGATAQAPENDVTFSAINSSAATTNDAVCTEGRSVP